jgi:hypothetical protein
MKEKLVYGFFCPPGGPEGWTTRQENGLSCGLNPPLTTSSG